MDFKSTASTRSATPPARTLAAACARCQCLWIAALYPLLAAHGGVPAPVAPVEEPPEGRSVFAYVARSRAELLPGRRAKSRAGDLVIGNRLVRFVVGSARRVPGFPSFTGYLLDAGRMGKPGDLLGAATLVVAFRGARSRARYDAVQVVRDGRDGTAAVRATGRLERWPAVRVVTEYSLGAWDEHLVLTTTLENTGGRRMRQVRLGDYLRWSNARTFFSGKGFRLRRPRHRSGWIARRGLGSSFAWFAPSGKVVSVVLTSHQGSRYNSAMRIFVKRADLPPGRKVRYTRALAVGQGDIADAARIVYSVRKRPVTRVRGRVTSARTGRPLAGARVRAYSRRGRVLVSEADARPDGRFAMFLPHGRYKLVAWEWGRRDSPPVAIDVGEKEIDGVDLRMGPAGRVELEVRDARTKALLPARLILVGQGGTRTPQFVPEREDRQFDNVIYSHTGRAVRNVPPGQYRALVTRGPEYTLAEQDLVVREGEVSRVHVTLDRVVDTAGFIACDFHLHSVNSQDSLVGLRARVTSLVSENVEFAVPTDHNHVTDYGPVVAALGVRRFIATVPGDEITTAGPPYLGHFNVFPVLPEVGTPGDGAFAFRRRRPSEIFAEVRAREGDERVIQVNHPRLGRRNGYWNNVGWDGARGGTDDPSYSPHYDAIEVFNGLDRTLDRTEQVLEEWFVLLSRGFRYTATGNSDSHRLGFEEVGYPRNFVAVPDDDPRRVDPQEVVESVRAGRVVVTNGPFLRVRARAIGKDGKPHRGPPVTESARGGRPSPFALRTPRAPAGPARDEGGMGDLVRAGPGGVAIEVEVQAAPWIDVRRIEVFGNGSLHKTVEVSRSSSVLRWRGQVRLEPKVDTWYVVLVRGRRPLPTVRRPDVPPLAFANPIWVDATGDGVFTPPLR